MFKDPLMQRYPQRGIVYLPTKTARLSWSRQRDSIFDEKDCYSLIHHVTHESRSRILYNLKNKEKSNV